MATKATLGGSSGAKGLVKAVQDGVVAGSGKSGEEGAAGLLSSDAGNGLESGISLAKGRIVGDEARDPGV